MSTSSDYQGPPPRRRLFISYARADRDAVNMVQENITAAHHDAWTDSRLEGGQVWWETILEQIRACDAVVLVLSPDVLMSEAAARERWYAQALGKPVIPVLIRAVDPQLMPPDIATLQFIDFLHKGALAGTQLATVLNTLPPAPPPPDPMPEPPPVPTSYLGDIAAQLRRTSLTADEQFGIAARLGAGLTRPKEREAVLELLGVLEQRSDLYHQTAQEIERIRQSDAWEQSHNAPWTNDPRPMGPSGLTVGGQAPHFGGVTRQNAQLPSPGPVSEWPVQPGRAGESQYPVLPPRNMEQTAPAPHWALSITSLILSLIALLPVGLVAVVMSGQVGSRWKQGNAAGAYKAAKQAQVWGWIGIAVGAVVLLYEIGSYY